MAFTVETGTGSTTANSYVSLAVADAYFEDHGAPAAWSDATDAVKQAALIQATQYVDAMFSKRWAGKKLTREQALDWPRFNAFVDGFYLPTTPLPPRLLDAVCEYALRAINDTTLLVDETDPAELSEQSVKVGPITVSEKYLGGKSPQKGYPLPERILRPLLVSPDELGVA